MDIVTGRLIGVTDDLKEAINELSIGILESENLVNLAGKLDLMEQELQDACNYIAQESTAIAAIRSSLAPIAGFFVNENMLPGPASKSKKTNVSSFSSTTASKGSLDIQMKESSSSSSPSSVFIGPLTTEEFDALPRYLKGRLTVDKTNRFIDDLNKLYQEKYTILRGNPARMSVDQRQRFFEWKESENEETQGRHFVSETDLKAKSTSNPANFKYDQVARSIMTILRQAGRIKEVRSTGIIRYLSLGKN